MTGSRHERGEHGFAMVAVMGVLLVATLFAVSAYAVATGDIKPSRTDQDDKAAYSAAEAGISYYAYHLTQDPDYWRKCVPQPKTGDPAPPVTQPWSSGATPVWANVPGSTAQYTVELLPAKGYTTCVAGNDLSMIDPPTGTFRIRATGRSNGRDRSVIATFRRTKFLDFLYFTDYETFDPLTYTTPSTYQDCAAYYPRPGHCTDIQFATGDVIDGPLHSNDQILTCGATFGHSKADPIELVRSFRKVSSGCSPQWTGTVIDPAPSMTMPTTNAALQSTAAPAYRFTGKTTIVLQGDSMQVTTGGSTSSMSLPPNGVVYVQNTSCTVAYTRQQDYPSAANTCGDLWLSGTANRSLTFAADNDIVLNGNLYEAGDAELGLIANGFVRVYHPVKNRGTDGFGNPTCTNASSTPVSEIDAAILSLTHSFIVDNWYCGSKLGNLTIKGAIAQKFRGPVGTSGGSGTGYIKAYSYDTRLRYSSPPYFIDPVQAPWRVIRQTEQLPPQ